MKKLTLAHSEAVSSAKMSLYKLLTPNVSPKLNQQIEKQIVQMGEVYWWVLHMIYNPELPFDDAALEKDIEQLHEDHSHGTETKPNRT